MITISHYCTYIKMIRFVGFLFLFEDQREYVTKLELLKAPVTVILQGKV